MSYWPIHNYRQRDKLPPTDPNKIIYGSHLSDDFEAIAKFLGVIESHIDKIEVAPEVDLSGLVEEAPTNGTAYVRANAAWVPVGTDGDGGGNPILPPTGGLTFWEELLEKPEGISALGYQNTIDGGTYNRRKIK